MRRIRFAFKMIEAIRAGKKTMTFRTAREPNGGWAHVFEVIKSAS